MEKGTALAGKLGWQLLGYSSLFYVGNREQVLASLVHSKPCIVCNRNIDGTTYGEERGGVHNVASQTRRLEAGTRAFASLIQSHLKDALNDTRVVNVRHQSHAKSGSSATVPYRTILYCIKPHPL